jgi:large subunit ribosomal protein L4
MRCLPRLKAGSIVVLENASVAAAKTKSLKAHFREARPGQDALIIDGAEVDENFALAARNIPNIDVLPDAGHQRLRHPAARDTLVLTKAAVDALEARFK